jgi:dinuclear metal center YbgI/SA1388 family protein
VATQSWKICLAYSVNTLQEVMDACEKLWPLGTAEDWDAPGLMLGNPGQQVRRVLMSVDVTFDVIVEARERDCELIISHHPMFLRGVQTLGEQTLKGALAAEAVRANLAVLAMHTNADFVPDGVTESLAKALGLTSLEALDTVNGHGRLGDVEPTSLLEFARIVARAIAPTAGGLRVSGNSQQTVRRVAVAGGAGDSLLAAALKSDADVFVTSDLRHHPVQDATLQARLSGRDFGVIDISHWAAEACWLEPASLALGKLLPGLEFVSSEIRTDPWDFAVMQ